MKFTRTHHPKHHNPNAANVMIVCSAKVFMVKRKVAIVRPKVVHGHVQVIAGNSDTLDVLNKQ